MSEEEETRIGVFVCSCGSNIGGLVDVKALAEYAKTLPNVVFTEDNLYTCSETGLAQIREGIREHNLNRVIVASCTPRTHEPLFRDCVEEEGVNEYLFNFVNIRDQCTWVHQKQPEEAFEKAKMLDIEHIPVTKSREDNSYIGILNCRAVRRSLSAEVLSRQQKADSMHSV